MTPSETERTKLTATYLNGLAIAAAAVGVLAPAVSLATSASHGSLAIVVLLQASCLVLSVGLHLIARAVLKGLDR